MNRTKLFINKYFQYTQGKKYWMKKYIFIAMSFYLNIVCENVFTQDILAHNIAIKRQKDIEIKI